MPARIFSIIIGALLAASSTTASAAGPVNRCAGIFGVATAPRSVTAANKLAIESKAETRFEALLGESHLPFGAVDFAKIRVSDLKPAFEIALEKATENLRRIRESKDAPTFENTIEALDAYNEPLDRITGIVSHYNTAQGSPAISKLAQEIFPRVAELSNSISSDRKLFERVDAVFKHRQELGLKAEKLRLLIGVRGQFAQPHMKPEKRARLNAIEARLTKLGAEVEASVVRARATYEYAVTDASAIEGLPAEVVASARARAEKKRVAGWVFDFNEALSSVIVRSPNRKVREEIWRETGRIGDAPESGADNRALVIEIAKLREERAHLLGKASHGALVTAGNMAKNPETVFKFLGQLADTYRPAALKELAELSAFAGHELEPWDLSYYSEKLRLARYSYDSEALRPFFPFEQVLNGFFFAAGKLYGIEFVARPDLTTWDKDVLAYEVKEKNGAHLALFYVDPYERPNRKIPGAWHFTPFKSGLFAGKPRRPTVFNVMNLKRPSKGQPSLLTLSDVMTVFHEGGHGLHNILSEARYRRYSGTAVPLDFVELPSQFMENFALAPEVLDVYARHYETGERIPPALVTRVLESRRFLAGLNGLANVRLSLLDMAWHSRDLSAIQNPEDIEAFEKEVVGSNRVMNNYGQLLSTTFTHPFSRGYAAGYYSYKWSDVLASDAFEVFRSAGLFNRSVTRSFRAKIMARGGTVDADPMYQDFRGGPADPAALLRQEGLLPPLTAIHN